VAPRPCSQAQFRHRLAADSIASWIRNATDAIQEPNRMGTAAKYATLAQEADDPQEREHYARLRDAWITLAKRCEPFNFPDVTDSEK
jgi:hypothetical protein